MANAHIKENILNQVDKLPYDMQLRVLDFANSLSPKGVKGDSLSKFRGSISSGDLKLIESAMMEGCEQVDMNGCCRFMV